MRRAARRDQNEHELISIARAFGARWVPTGPLDGWICFRGIWTPIEIKHGRNGYTEAQRVFLAECAVRRDPVYTWRTPRDVFESLGAQE